MTHGLALAYRYLGDHDRAKEHYQHSIDLLSQPWRPDRRRHGHLNLALVFETTDEIGEAMRHAELSLETFRAAGHRSGEAKALNALGWYQGRLGQHRSALANCQLALASVTELGDRYGQALTWDSVGYVQHQLGDLEAATVSYQRSLDLWYELADRLCCRRGAGAVGRLP